MNTKKWTLCLIALWLVLMICSAAATGIIDPFFHYHAPLDALEYPINNQRYQNDGISKNFSYDALITGTSMTENFKTSEFDSLFGTNAIKVSFSGGTYTEITTNLQAAMEANPDIRYVLYGLDLWNLCGSKELILANGEYPTYLYDDNLFNDVQYVLNKEILFHNTIEVLRYTRNGGKTTSFDEYSAWSTTTGKKIVLANYNRAEQAEAEVPFTEETARNIRESLGTHILSLAKAHPETEFLFFFPPYSVLTWDAYIREGMLDTGIASLTLASELLTQADNIQLYSFYTDYETCTNLDNYLDNVHHHSDINSLLLQRIQQGEYRLTKDNYRQHWEEVREFYSNYDYEAIFAETAE